MSVIRFRDESGKVHEIIALRGVSGKDGRTPEKGVDYYTEADKAEMVQAVLEALPVYNGETENNTFNFKINNSSFIAVAGMTWCEFVNSEYVRPIDIDGVDDTLVCSSPDDLVVTEMYGMLVTYINENDDLVEVTGNQVIIENLNYNCG